MGQDEHLLGEYTLEPDLVPGVPDDVPRITELEVAEPTILEPQLAIRRSHRFIPHFIVLALFMIFVGKIGIRSHPFLYVYGLMVTAVPLVAFFITFTRYEDPASIGQSVPKYKRKNYFVSCLVAVRNEEKIIEQCIKSLINTTYPSKEIIFINDASTDGTKEILATYHDQGLITAIHLDKNVGKKRALAHGMLCAKGDIFAFSDSDTVLAPDAISRVVDAFQSDQLIGAVSGHCRALNAKKNLLTKIQDSWYEGQFSIRKAFESVYGCVTCVSGPLAAFRREAIYNYIPAWANDSFLGQEFRFATDRTLTGFVLGNKTIGDKLKKKYSTSVFVDCVDYPTRDWKVVYSKSARAWTEVPDSFKRLINQQIRWKKSFIRNMFFTGAFYWKKPLLPALGYYLHILFVLAGPFVAFRHLIYLPLQGDTFSFFFYLGGITFVGFMFGLAYKLENRDCHVWLYRPLMSLLSTLILSWLIFYSTLTIKKMIWVRG